MYVSPLLKGNRNVVYTATHVAMLYQAYIYIVVGGYL
jgi:hypothetical protein